MLSVKESFYGVGKPVKARAKAASEYYAADNVVNHAGMSGFGSHIHRHATNEPHLTMWLTIEGDKDRDIVFEFEHEQQLGYMFVWNFCRKGKTENGLKAVRIFYASEPDRWRELKGAGYPYVFAKAGDDGPQRATNLVGGDPVDFAGVTARYVKISPREEDGNYGGKQYGLAEVRFFTYKPQVEKGAYLPAWTLDSQTLLPKPEQANLVNGKGLNHPSGADALCSAQAGDMYKSEQPEPFLFELDGVYPIDRMVVWNYNEAGATEYGLKTAKISCSRDLRNWEVIAESHEFKPAPGVDGARATDVIPFGNIRAKFVRIEPLAGGNPQPYYGLAAVRFYAGEGMFTQPRPDWTGLFSNYHGWSGADGIYSISLDRKETPDRDPEAKDEHFFLFSDTFISEVDPVRQFRRNSEMINNSFAILRGNNPYTADMQFVYSGERIPLKPAYKLKESHDAIYWLSDLYYANGRIYTFPIYIAMGDSFGFDHKSNDMAWFEVREGKIDFDSLTIVRDTEQRLFYHDEEKKQAISLGSAIMPNTVEAGAPDPDGYVYVYGFKDRVKNMADERYLVVARFKAEEFGQLDRLEYYDGDGWSKRIEDVALLARYVSPELSVTPIREGKWKGKYLLVYTHRTSSAIIAGRIGDSPVGPFSDEFVIDYVTDHRENEHYYTYNAKCHPNLSAKGELLISYNVNFNPNKLPLHGHPDCYRPRFISLRGF